MLHLIPQTPDACGAPAPAQGFSLSRPCPGHYWLLPPEKELDSRLSRAPLIGDDQPEIRLVGRRRGGFQIRPFRLRDAARPRAHSGSLSKNGHTV